MLRSLIIVAVVFLLYLLIKNRLKTGNSQSSNTTTNTKTSSNHEKTVPCIVCEAYIPESEAIIYDNKHFCCQQHLRDWQSR